MNNKEEVRQEIERRFLMYIAKIQYEELKAHKDFKVMQKTQAHDIVKDEIIDYIFDKFFIEEKNYKQA